MVRDGNGMYGTDLGALSLKGRIGMRICVGDSGSSPLTDESAELVWQASE